MSTPPKSELDEGLASLNRVVNGVAGRLLGPRILGRDTLPETPAISPEADAAVERAGEVVGRILHTTGEALKEHPLDPVGLLDAVQHPTDGPVPAAEGWSPLAGGLKTFGEGMMAVAEGVLDKVAPKKPKE